MAADLKGYLLSCPLARKREDMLSLGTLLRSAVDGHEVLERNKIGEEEENHRDTDRKRKKANRYSL